VSIVKGRGLRIVNFELLSFLLTDTGASDAHRRVEMSRIASKSVTSGSSHTSYLSGGTMTACGRANRRRGNSASVMIVQLSTISPSGFSTHPTARERKDITFTTQNSKAASLIHLPPLVESIRRIRQRFLRIESRNAGFDVTSPTEH